jgi:hypothetical protein
MPKRPGFLTTLAILLIVFGIFNFSTLVLQLNTPAAHGQLHPHPLSLYTELGLSLAAIVSGFGLFKGYAWSRMVFVAMGVCWPLKILLAQASFGHALIYALMYAGLAIYLYSNEVNAYFKKN